MLLLAGKNITEAYQNLQNEIPAFLHALAIPPEEIARFHRMLNGNIGELPEETISGSGYVVHTLEASIWCLLTTGNYRSI